MWTSLSHSWPHLIDFALSVLRISLPLTLAAIAGFWSEKSGIPQVGLEGFLLLGALAGATFVNLTSSMTAGFGLTLLAGAIAGYGFYICASRMAMNAILIGLVFNLLIAGLAPFVTKLVFGSTGSTPMLDPALRWTIFPYLWALGSFVVSYIVFSRTGFGLLVRFAGLKPVVIESAGFSVLAVQRFCLILCGVLATSGGFILSTFLASSYSPMMSAGRGFMALAALVFARWDLRRTFMMALVFGLFEAAQIYLQSFETPLPSQFFQALPYLMTLIILALGSKTK
jgi:general nucleoside transport system permease protein